MPKLRGEDIPRGVGPSQQRTDVRDDEILVGCPLLTGGCDWQTVRPLHAAHSAQDAHRIKHQKGMA